MAITKDEVVAKAAELSLKLTDEQIDQHVKDQKLPEKPENKSGTSIEDLIVKYSQRQLAEMLLETRSEAAERRRENKTLKEQAEGITREVQELSKFKTQTPELEAKLRGLETQLQGVKDSEKKRRELALAKLDEKKKPVFSYLSDVEKISADQFDATMETLVEPGTNGTTSQTPAPGAPKRELTTDEKREADRMGLDAAGYLEVMETRKKSESPKK